MKLSGWKNFYKQSVNIGSQAVSNRHLKLSSITFVLSYVLARVIIE